MNTGLYACPCCGKGYPSDKLRDILEQMDRSYKITLTSVFRCPKHDREVGGSGSGEHCDGNAADISVTGDRLRFQLVKLALDLGVKRLGVGPNFIHVGVGPEPLGQDAMWVY